MARLLGGLAGLLVLSCASTPSAPPGATGAWGYVRLVPRDGVHVGGGGAAYGDRRLADVTLVDYSKPGFVVVYAEGTPPAASTARLVLRDRAAGPRFEPDLAAVATGGTIEVRNESKSPLIVSAREHGRIESIAPGGTVRFAAADAGEHRFAVVSEPNVDARVFVAPGPFAVVSDSGRFELWGIEPGRRRVVAWHPRLPATTHWLDLAPGETTRLDIEVGVDRPHEVGASASNASASDEERR